MSVGAYVGIGIAAFVVFLFAIALLIVFIISKKCTFVCDHCGHTFKAKFTELLISPNMMLNYALTCPKCGEVGAHKE